MNTKLGLVIYITAGGRERHSGWNEGDWVRYVPDVREALQRTFPGQEDLARNGRPVSGAFSGSGGLVCMVNFIPQGAMFTIIKAAVGGRANDNTAATLFIPDGILINGLQTLQTINRVREIISHPTAIDTTALANLMAADYPMGKTPQPLNSPRNSSYAVVYYGGNSPLTLENLLGQSLYQPEYARYQSVFFADATKRYDIYGNVSQIPADKIVSMIEVFPPKSNNGFQAFIKASRKPFNENITVARGSDVTIEWQRQGYAPVEKTFTVFDATSARLAVPVPSDIKVRIPRSAIQVRNSKGRPLSKAVIVIDGRQFTGDYMDISEAALNKGLKLTIEANGYEPYHGQISGSLPVTCPMERKYIEKNYVIYAKDEYGNDVEVGLSLKSTRPLGFSPLKGYNNDGRNVLEYVGDTTGKLLWGACGLAAGLLIWLIVAWAVPTVTGWFSKTSDSGGGATVEETTGGGTDTTQNIITPQPTEQDWAAACKYLDDNKIWEQERMETDFNGALAGLFDDLNNFRRSELETKWTPFLKDSRKFGDVLDAYKKGSSSYNYGEFNTFTAITMTNGRIDRGQYYNWVGSSDDQKERRFNQIRGTSSPGSSQVNGSEGTTDKVLKKPKPELEPKQELKTPGTTTL